MTDPTTLEHHMNIMRVFEQNPDAKYFKVHELGCEVSLHAYNDWRMVAQDTRYIVKVEPVK